MDNRSRLAVCVFVLTAGALQPVDAQDVRVRDGILQVIGTHDNDDIVVATRMLGAEEYVTVGFRVWKELARGVATNTYWAEWVRRSEIEGLQVFGRRGKDVIDNRTDLKSEIYGGAHSDLLFAGTGINTMSGGSGDDQLQGFNASFAAFDGGSGDDVVFGSLAGVSDLAGGVGHDCIVSFGDDLIRGGDGSDMIVTQSPLAICDAGRGADAVFVAYGVDLDMGPWEWGRRSPELPPGLEPFWIDCRVTIALMTGPRYGFILDLSIGEWKEG